MIIGRVTRARDGERFVAEVLDRSGNILNASDPLETRGEAKREARRLETVEINRRMRKDAG